MKVGINGYGRIGKILHRIISANKELSLVAINDINPDKNNIAYLANYDSTYGSLDEKYVVDGDYIVNSSEKVEVFSYSQIDDVPWSKSKVDVVIDSSGVTKKLD